MGEETDYKGKHTELDIIYRLARNSLLMPGIKERPYFEGFKGIEEACELSGTKIVKAIGPKVDVVLIGWLKNGNDYTEQYCNFLSYSLQDGDVVAHPYVLASDIGNSVKHINDLIGESDVNVPVIFNGLGQSQAHSLSHLENRYKGLRSEASKDETAGKILELNAAKEDNICFVENNGLVDLSERFYRVFQLLDLKNIRSDKISDSLDNRGLGYVVVVPNKD